MATKPAPFHVSFLSFFLVIVAATSSNEYVQSSKTHRPLQKLRKEKLGHLHFYFHDVVSGPNPTAVRVAAGPERNKSLTGFGTVVMTDDPLTVGPELTSKVVGRAQGIYALATLQLPPALLMVMNFVFTEGKFNGSTLSILGRNAVFSEVREMPVIGGSGLFRFARGYALAHTHYFNLKTGDASVEYNVYVMHY